MARIPDKIKSIDGSRETLKLAVRIIDLWFVGTPNKSEQAQMVIVVMVCDLGFELLQLSFSVISDPDAERF